MSEDTSSLAPAVAAAFDVVGSLTPEAFHDWLSGQPQTRVVGEFQEPESCPLARYLETRLPGLWWVFPDGVEFEGPGEPHPVLIDLPDWAERFVSEVDDVPNRTPGGWRRRRVRAGEALALLDAALAPSPPGDEA